LNNSFAINLNIFRYAVRLGGPTSKFSGGTGFGIGWDVYRFLDNSMIPTKFDGEFSINPYDGGQDRNFKRSALRTTWLRVPLYLQYSKSRHGSLFATAGVVGNVRMGASSRQVYDLYGKKSDKTKDHFYLNAFRADAELRLGYENLSVFATYSLTNMFLKNRGPELTTYSFGISLGS
jgi:hypothetical protein